MRTKVMLFLVSVLLCFSLAGCTDYQAIGKEQADAIEATFEAAAESTDEFYYFEYDDIQDQINAQTNGKPQNKKQADYELTIALPDIADVWEDDIQLKIPDYDLNNADIDAYKQEYLDSARESFEEYILDGKCGAYSDFTLRYALEKTAGTWSTEMRSAELARICAQSQESIMQQSEQLFSQNEDYRKLLLAQEIFQQVNAAVDNPAYVSAFSITDINKTKDGYSIDLEFPRADDIFAKAAQLTYDGYAQEGKAQYAQWTLGPVESELSGKIAQVVDSSTAAMQKVSFTASADGECSEGLFEAMDHIKSEQTQRATELMEKLNAEFLILEQDRPATGILYGASKGQSIRIKTSDQLGDIFITFYKLSGTDLSESGTKVISGYIRAGDTLSIRLPAGNYKFIQGSGATWYGEERAFGPGGIYELADMLINIQGGRYYTLTLYGVQDGNMPTKNIPFPFS